MKEEFIAYVEAIPKSQKSGDKYAGAIKTISEKFINKDIFQIQTEKDFNIILSQLENNSEFNELNDRGHNMYSRALKCYKEFLSQSNKKDYILSDIQKYLAAEMLQVVVKGGYRIEYGELANNIKKKYGIEIDPHLGIKDKIGEISELCHNVLGLPMLSAVVVNNQKGDRYFQKPGSGFYSLYDKIHNTHIKGNPVFEEKLLKEVRKEIQNCDEWYKLTDYLGIHVEGINKPILVNSTRSTNINDENYAEHKTKVVMPKNSALLEEIEAVLKIYYEENDWLSNDIYKARLKDIIGADQYSSSYTKKAQITSYFGMTIWQDINNPRSLRKITALGREFYLSLLNNDKEKMQELLLQSLETIKFGRDNYGCPESDSDIEPPILCIRAILDLEYITYKEFAFLLYSLADESKEYAETIKEIIRCRNANSSLTISEEANKYQDAKPLMVLVRWGFLNEERVGQNTRITISKYVKNAYEERLNKLNIYNTDKQIVVEEFSINNDEIEAFETLLDNVEEYHDEKIKQASVLELGSSTLNNLNNRPPESINTRNGRKYKTDARIIKTACKLNNYSCVVDPNHPTFISTSDTNYVEGHHIIPMCAQKDFEINIDRIENIATLCPLCHKAIHHANKEYKRELLSKIYNPAKQEELKNLGINITLDDLLNKYY